MAKTGGSRYGCSTVLGLIIVLGILAKIINFCEHKNVPPTPPVQTENEKKQQQIKEDAERLETERRTKLEEQKRSKIKEAAESRFVFSDMTVKDKGTGLVWTRNGAIYNYCTWSTASDIIKTLNEEKYGGYNNWRLPSKKELLKMIDFAYSVVGHPERAQPYIILNQIGFSNVACGMYWSNDTVYTRTRKIQIGNNKTKALRDYKVWQADMCNGEIVKVWEDTYWASAYFWPVRSGR
jgi:hypothetical protein